MEHDIAVFGTDTCKDTVATRKHLDRLGVAYDYVNIERDADAAKQVERWNDGERKTPTVVLESGQSDERRVLAVPSDTELDAALDETRLMPDPGLGDGSPGVRDARD